MRSEKKYRKLFHMWPSRLSALWLLACLFLAFFASWIASDYPLFARVEGESVFPAFTSHGTVSIRNPFTGQEERVKNREVDWKNNDDAFVIWPLVTYHPGSIDLQNSGYASPFKTQHYRTREDSVTKLPLRFRHWLGTTQTGNDVLSGIIHGTRISLSIGILSMLIAGIIGIAFGVVSGYTADEGLKVSLGVLLMLLAGILPAYFFAFYLRLEILMSALQSGPFHFLISSLFSLLIFLGVMMLFFYSGKILKKLNPFHIPVVCHVDIVISRILEVFSSIPKLILIITISALARPSLMNLVLILGFTAWTDIGRIMRAEMLKIKSSDYIQIARAQGISTARIMFRHALPNIVRPAIVSILFGVASVILIESSLSFLGIGVPFETITWGSLIAAGKENLDAWWLILFPGLCIFFTVASLNILSDAIADPKQH